MFLSAGGTADCQRQLWVYRRAERSAILKGLEMCDQLWGLFSFRNALVNLISVAWVFQVDIRVEHHLSTQLPYFPIVTIVNFVDPFSYLKFCFQHCSWVFVVMLACPDKVLVKHTSQVRLLLYSISFRYFSPSWVKSKLRTWLVWLNLLLLFDLTCRWGKE